MSLKLSVTASARRSTSPGPGAGVPISSSRRTSRGGPCSTATQARTTVLRGGVEREREVRETAHVAGVRALHRLAQLVVGVAAQELLERDARLQAGERGTDAQMDAEPEPDVPFDVAVDVEVLGIGERPLVVVGGTGDQDHPRVGGDGDPVQRDVLLDPAALVVR